MTREEFKDIFLIVIIIVLVIAIGITTVVYRPSKTEYVEKDNTVSQKFDSLVNSNSAGIDKNKYDIIIINKEKDEAIKVSRTLNDSAAIELFKSLVAE